MLKSASLFFLGTSSSTTSAVCLQSGKNILQKIVNAPKLIWFLQHKCFKWIHFPHHKTHFWHFERTHILILSKIFWSHVVSRIGPIHIDHSVFIVVREMIWNFSNILKTSSCQANAFIKCKSYDLHLQQNLESLRGW